MEKTCRRCRQPHSLETLLCQSCKDKAKGERRLREEQYKEQGLCFHCGEPARSESTRCQACWEKHRSRNRSRRKEPGRCYRCGSSTDHPKGGACSRCTLKETSYRYFGTKTKWKELESKLRSQGSRCVYSGRLLDVHSNAQLDHIVPKSQGGSDSMENFQWVDQRCNAWKSSMPEAEFLQLVEEIYHHRVATHEG